MITLNGCGVEMQLSDCVSKLRCDGGSAEINRDSRKIDLKIGPETEPMI